MADGNLRKLFRENLPRVHWQSIETGATGEGVPDSNGCVAGNEFWVEHKMTTGWRVEFQTSQPAWIHRRYRAGGRVWIAVRQVLPDDDLLWMFYGGVVRELMSDGLRISPAHVTGCWRGGPRRWNWGAVERLLQADRPASPADAGDRGSTGR